MEDRHIPNDADTPLALAAEPEILLRSALQRILNSSPPQSNYTKDQLGGVLRGHTGIAYLFLHVYSSLPRLQIHGYSALHWAKAYISGKRGPLALEPGNCGLGSECLSHAAVKACITKDLNDVRFFLSSLPQILAPARQARPSSAEAGGAMDVDGDQQGAAETLDPFPSELLNGRAGTLYLLRLIRHWVPQSAPLVQLYIVHLAERILTTDDDGRGNWLYSGKHYLGAAHGEIGIITQLVVTEPPLAPRLEAKLGAFLDLQLPDGNWPSSLPATGSEETSPRKSKSHLVQWCHGAPGVVVSLLSLRPFYPKLRDKIDTAIEKGRQLTWKKGLLRKEPSLCHGILGNSLYVLVPHLADKVLPRLTGSSIFPPGPQREHFLAMAAPTMVSDMRRKDDDIFQPASYGKDSMILMSYESSAAWTWLVCQRKLPRMLLYNDM